VFEVGDQVAVHVGGILRRGVFNPDWRAGGAVTGGE